MKADHLVSCFVGLVNIVGLAVLNNVQYAYERWLFTYVKHVKVILSTISNHIAHHTLKILLKVMKNL